MTKAKAQGDITEMMELIRENREAKKVFLAMPREEQLLAILEMIAYGNSQFAILQKQFIDHQADSDKYRAERERREKQLVDILDTDPKIKALSDDEKQTTVQKILAMATRPARNGGLFDKIASLVLVIVFVLFLMGKLP